MGSRAVVLLSRNPGRFTAPPDWRGTVYTRTGRPFFDDALTKEFVGKLDDAVEAAGLWAELGSDWMLLDAELLPWSLKAGEMIRNQYAAVGAAATATLGRAVKALSHASANGGDVRSFWPAPLPGSGTRTPMWLRTETTAPLRMVWRVFNWRPSSS